MIDYYQFLALLFTVLAAFSDVLTRAYQRQSDRSWLLALLGSGAGSLVLLLWGGFPDLNIDGVSFIMVLASGILWAVMVTCEFRCQAYSEAGKNAILDTLRTVLLVAAGALIFNEQFTRSDAFASVLIITGIAFASELHLSASRRGAFYKVMSVLTGSIAIVIDKLLVNRTSLWLVICMGYFIPLIIFLIKRPANWREQLSSFTESKLWIASGIIAIYIVLGPIMICAFGNGELGATFLIVQCKPVFVLAMAALFLGERGALKRRFAAAILCIIGIVLLS